MKRKPILYRGYQIELERLPGHPRKHGCFKAYVQFDPLKEAFDTSFGGKRAVIAEA